MSCAKDHREFCAHHAARETRNLEKTVALPLAREILGGLTDLRSTSHVNHALGNLFILSADERISARRSANLCYLAQLLLQSAAAIERSGQPADAAQCPSPAGSLPPSPSCQSAPYRKTRAHPKGRAEGRRK